MKRFNWTIVISIIAIVISILAICTSLQSFSVSETAYLGWIVSVLSTLVVVLIGWQIYSFFNIKDSIETLESTKKSIDYQLCRVETSTAMVLSDMYYRMLTDDKRNFLFKFLHSTVLVIMHASKMKDLSTCNVMVKVILEVIAKPEMLRLSKYNKELIFDVLSSVSYGNKIEQYTDLLQLLSRIETE
jgi:hypothetical protein